VALLIWCVQDQVSIVAVVLEVFFARDVDLGRDPTVKRTCDGSLAYYDITIHVNINNKAIERIYRTSQTLSDRSADALRGRGTRVFKAHLLDAEGKETGDAVVIKDVWSDSNRDREGDIMREICNEVSSEDVIKLRKYLLTVECHGDVLINGKPD
jgi:hypothetical protein